MHYMPVDHVVDMEFGYWDEVHLLWEKEGLPPGLDTHEKLELYFGLERRKHRFINVWAEPEFEVNAPNAFKDMLNTENYEAAAEIGLFFNLYV